MIKFSTKRAERRATERIIENALKNLVIVDENPSFSLVKSDLLSCGWDFIEEFGNMVEIRKNKYSAKKSPALKFNDDVFNITLIPHKNGIELSRLKVYHPFRSYGVAGQFLLHFLIYLATKSITDIYLIPIPAGTSDIHDGTTLDINQLRNFYHKRGFVKQDNDPYWKLNYDLFYRYLISAPVNPLVYEKLISNILPKPPSSFSNCA